MRGLRRDSGGTWGRLERRALAGYQRDQLAGLQKLAADTTAIISLDTQSSAPVPVLRLRLAGWALTLVGVIPAYRDRLSAQLQAGLPLRLVDGGRYTGLWWIAVSDGRDVTLVAGSHLRLTFAGGGVRPKWNGAPLVG